MMAVNFSLALAITILGSSINNYSSERVQMEPNGPVRVPRNPTGSDQPAPFIVGGKPVKAGEAVSLQHRTGKHLCGGVVYDHEHVLTAAQCVAGTEPWDWIVQFGLTNLDHEGPGGFKRRIRNYTVHPDWINNDRYWDYDIAVCKVKPVPYSCQGTIKPACLADEWNDFPAGTEAMVVGWGHVNKSDSTEPLPPPRALQGVNVTVTDREECSKLYQGRVTDQMLCAGNMMGNHDTCTGDAGGPMFVKQGDVWIVVGLNIRGPATCGAPNMPSVYLAIGSFRTFIESVTEDRSLQELKKRLDDAERHIVALTEELNGTTNRLESNVSLLDGTDKRLESRLSLLEKAAKPKVSFTAALGYEYAAPQDKRLRLVFGVVLNNVGGAYDAKKGIFRAPVRGNYYIGFILTTHRYPNAWRPCHASLVKNGHDLASSFSYIDRQVTVSDTQNGGTTLVVHLEEGDQVWVELWDHSIAFDLPDRHLSTFTGFLVDAL